MARQRVQLNEQNAPDQVKAQLDALDWSAGSFDVVIQTDDGDRIVLDGQTDASTTKDQLDAMDWTGGPRNVTVQLNEP